MGVYAEINNLISYAKERGLIAITDETYIRNSLLSVLGISDYEPEEPSGKSLEETLSALCSYGEETGVCGGTQSERDLFDTRLMGELTPRPSEVISEFCERYMQSPELATDWYYNFSQDTDYIRRYRIARDMKWTADTEYGKLDITVNLSKPEKDPRDIAKAKSAPKSGYPACLLCAESEGYAGRANFPARQNHRVIPIEICGEEWGFQYSPYVYYNEHCIAFNKKHTPMKIDAAVFSKLFSFLDVFPHYFIGSNADLPIVGGSILSHEHFQGGRYTFAMERAPVEKEYDPIFGVKLGRVKWPMSVLRLSGEDKENVAAAASHILDRWRGYTDESAFVFAETEGTPHNTVTPIARKRGGIYELDIVLRNNITTKEHPLGVFHPHEELHHIKKENIGLIEVMGLAVLPSRLKSEIAALVNCAENGESFDLKEETKKHASWARKVVKNKKETESYEDLFKREIGNVFKKVLECAGVFKRDENGTAAFSRFVKTL